MFSSGQKGFSSSTPFGGTAGSSVFSQSSGFTFGSQPSQPQSTGLFGNPSFAQPTQTSQPSTGLFGTQPSQPAQTGGLFGASNPTSNVFGAKATFGGTGTGFGATSTGTGLFGSTTGTAAAPTTGTGLFGSGAPSGGGLFGSVTAAAPSAGGTTTKFVPPTSTDTAQRSGTTVTVNTKHQCITAMKEYESKSLEELRLEDYAANRKGPQAGTATAPAGGGGIFGTTPAAPGFGSFGNPTASTSNSLFGSTTQPTGTGLFGAAAQRPLFGGTPTTTSSSVFATTGKTLFETSAMNQNKGLFGTNTGTSTSGFLFGQPNPAQPAATAGTGLFGVKTAFGTATTSAPGFGTGGGAGLFGGAPSTGLFGGAKTTGGFGFGTTTTATTATAPFSFGTGTSAAGGLFGSSAATAPKPAAFGFPSSSQAAGPTIGSAAPFGQGQGLFGQSAGNTSTGATRPLFGTGTGGLGFNFSSSGPGLGMGGPGILGQPQAANQPAAIGLSANPDIALAQQARIQQQVLDLVVNLPYGHSSLFKNTLRGLNKSGAGGGSSQPDRPLPIPTNPESQRAATQQMRLNVSGRATSKPRTRPLGVVNNGANSGGSPVTSGKRQLFTGLDEEELARADNFFVRRSDWMKLNIPGGSSNNSVCSDVPLPANGKSFPEVEVSTSPATDNSRKDGETSFRQSLPMSGDRVGVSHDISCWRGPDDDDPSILVLPDSSSQPEPHPCKVVLNKAGYYCIPSLDEIAEQGLDSDGRCLIENLVVGHKGYGRVLFLGTTDVAGLDFDAAVHIRRKEITVYPDDTSKPKVGDGLNKKAEVTLIGVWPTDKATGEPIKDPIRLEKMHFADKLERATSKMGARFIEYQPESGSWVFEVKHFSKYRYDESDDDEAVETEVAGAEGQTKVVAEDQIKISNEKNMEIAEVQGATFMERNQNNKESKDKSGYGQLQKTVDKIGLLKETGYPEDEAWVVHKDSDGLSSSEGEAAGLAVDGLIDEMPPWPVPPGQAEERIRKMYPAPRTLGGVSTQSVQLMKASFFGTGVDLDEDGVSVNDDVVSGQLSSAYDSHINAKRQRLFTPLSPSPLPLESPRQSYLHESGSPHRGRHSRILSQSLLSLDPQPPQGPSSTVRESESSRLLPASLRLGLPAFAKLPQLRSLDDDERERNLWMDEGWNRGNGCRVAWGPDNVVWPPTTPWSEEDKDEDKMEGDGLWTECDGLNRVILATTPGRNEIHESLLNLSLETSELSIESDCPQWTPIEGRLPLSSYDSALTPDDEKISALRRAVDLCSALWGRLESPEEEEEDENSYAMRMERKEALSAWLRSEVLPVAEGAVGRAENSAEATFAWLTAGCLPEACQAAQKGSEHRLALLVAQARGSDCMRRMLIRQLEEWREVGMDTRISAAHLRLYALLAGHMTWRGSTPDGPTALSRGSHSPLVNVCADLDWLRAFAVHLWYNCAFHQDISHALAAYKASFRGSDRYAAPPLPQGSDYQHWDVAYHLLQLHCKRCHRLEKLLCPETFGRDGGGPHEWQAVWHLWRILDALGYRHLGPVRFAQLQCEFADQLERGGVWEWAVFVLLHLQDPTRREAAVRELLARRVGEEVVEDENEMDDAEMGECEARRERFLVERLKVPAAWIYEAKAVRARFRGDPVAETQLWTAAQRWEEAHQVLISGLCSRLVVAGEVEELEALVKPLSSPEAVVAIRQWNTGGQLFLDWVNLRKEVDSLKSEDVYSMESVRHRVVSICDRLEYLNARDTLEKMCHSEIAKDCARVLRLLTKDASFIYEVSRLLTQLPLPEDSHMTESMFLRCQRLTSLQTS